MEWAAACIGWSLLAALASLIVLRLSPPAVVPGGASAQAFSAGRARAHVAQIAQTPHPSGSPAARAVEVYLLQTLGALGLRVEVQAAPACVEAAGLRRCGHVRNVLATLPGRSHDGAVLLSAHYDSVANAPGAGDDAAAVAALLETARALTHGAPLRHDVIFALLDAEEDLLLGSAALCGDATRLSRVRLVANFDARGSRGPVTLIGASRDTGAVIGELGHAVEHPVLSSFYPSVARVLPNATDAEVYDRCGLKALSFAFADGFENYHQGTDDPDHLDDRSLQHQGDYALAFARRFTDSDQPELEASSGESVFFDLGSFWVVRYPDGLGRIFALALVVATCIFIERRRRAERLRGSTLVAVTAAYAASLVAAALAGAIVVHVVSLGWGFWSSYRHAGALVGCAACCVSAGYLATLAIARRRWSAETCALGPLLLWVGLAGSTAALVPGMSHVFTWPGVALLAACALRRPGANLGAGFGANLVQYALLTPAVLMLTPVIYTLVVVIGAPGAAAAMPCVVLLLGAGSAPLRLLADRARQASLLLLAAGVVGAAWLELRVRTEPAPPVGNAIAYAVENVARRARWVSPDGFEDTWKRQFLGEHPELGRSPELFSERPLLMGPAPFTELASPVLELVSDSWAGDERTLVLRVSSRRAARTLTLWEPTGVQFDAFDFDGSTPLPLVRFSPELDRKLLRLLGGLSDGGLWSVTMFASPASGSLLALSTRHAGPLELRILDRTEGLAVLPDGFVPRPATFTPGYPGDHTLVSGAPLAIGPLPRR